MVKSGIAGGIVFGLLIEVTGISYAEFNSRPLSLRLEVGQLILALIVGIFIAIIFAAFLDWFYAKLPTRHAISKSMILMLVAYFVLEGFNLAVTRPAKASAVGILAPILPYMLVAAVIGSFYAMFNKLGKQNF